jgi:hypothetical protein
MNSYHPPRHRRFFAVALFVGFAAASLVSAQAGDLLAHAVVTRPAHGIRHVLDSMDARINIDPSETLHFDLHLSGNSGVARVVAPNGGAFNEGKKTVEVDAAKNGPAISFDFSAGPNPGRYTVEVTHGNETRTFEFWAGQEPPRGKPGPALTFSGSR